MKQVTLLLACSLLGACAMTPSGSAPDTAGPPGGRSMILVRPTTKSPDQVVDAIKSHAETNKWVYLGANKVKNGEVTLVKVCIPAVGAVVWGAGLEYSALLPCGNLAVYQKSGRTEVSMLDVRYMEVVAPMPETKRAVEMAQPLLAQMLDTLAR